MNAVYIFIYTAFFSVGFFQKLPGAFTLVYTY